MGVEALQYSTGGTNLGITLALGLITIEVIDLFELLLFLPFLPLLFGL